MVSGPVSGTYAAWVTWLEAFRRGEDPGYDRLEPIDGRLGSYMEARLLDKLSSAFTERVRQWQADLADAVVRRPPPDAPTAAAMLREASARLDPLARLAGSALLPPPLATAMHSSLRGVRDGAREALDDAWRRWQAEIAVPGAGAVPRPRTGRPVFPVRGGDRGGRVSRSPQEAPPTARVGGDGVPGRAVVTPPRAPA